MTTPSDAVELRVMVVDDNIDAATTLSHLLQVLGCKTAVAFGGAGARRVARLFRPNLLFLDLELEEEEDGCGVLHSLHEQAVEGPRAFCVCLTGRGDPGEERRCLQAGFDLFIAKPMEPDALTAVLHAARTFNRAASSASGGATPPGAPHESLRP